MRLNLKGQRVKLQIFFMIAFLMLTILLMIQQYENEHHFGRPVVKLDHSVFCISEVCLGQECLEVPGAPRLAKLLIVSSFDNKEVKHIKIILYKDKICGKSEDR